MICFTVARIPLHFFFPTCVHLVHDVPPSLQGNTLPVDGFVYEQLKDTIKGFEVAGYKTKKEGSAFISFSSDMQLVDSDRRGLEWAWVRCRNVKTFVGDI